MSATALFRLGQVNAAGDTEALFKTVMSGLVLHHFQKGLKFKPKIRSRGFPVGNKGFTVRLHGPGSAKYHTAGQNIVENGAYLSNFKGAELTVLANDKLLDATIVDDVEKLKADFDEQTSAAIELSRSLYDADDKYCLRAILAAAWRNDTAGAGGDKSKYTGEPTTGLTTGGNLAAVTLSAGTAVQKADRIVEAIYAAKDVADGLDWPMDRFLAIDATIVNLLFQATNKEFLNRDWGGNGSVSSGQLMQAAGFTIVPTTNFPKTDLSGDTARQTELNRDFTNQIGVFFTPEAAVRAEAKGFNFDYGWERLYQAWLAIASTVTAYGSLRRECAIGMIKN